MSRPTCLFLAVLVVCVFCWSAMYPQETAAQSTENAGSNAAPAPVPPAASAEKPDTQTAAPEPCAGSCRGSSVCTACGRRGCAGSGGSRRSCTPSYRAR
jgi:hypothetical protein